MKIVEILFAIATMLVFICIIIACNITKELQNLQKEEDKKSDIKEED